MDAKCLMQIQILARLDLPSLVFRKPDSRTAIPFGALSAIYVLERCSKRAAVFGSTRTELLAVVAECWWGVWAWRVNCERGWRGPRGRVWSRPSCGLLGTAWSPSNSVRDQPGLVALPSSPPGCGQDRRWIHIQDHHPLKSVVTVAYNTVLSLRRGFE